MYQCFCDNCNEELEENGHIKFMIELKFIQLRKDAHEDEEFFDNKHFCGLFCLKRWCTENV
jgi:hypothetical protein